MNNTSTNTTTTVATEGMIPGAGLEITLMISAIAIISVMMIIMKKRRFQIRNTSFNT